MKTKEEILHEITKIPIYRLEMDDRGEYLTKQAVKQAMQEYADQQVQAKSEELLAHLRSKLSGLDYRNSPSISRKSGFEMAIQCLVSKIDNNE